MTCVPLHMIHLDICTGFVRSITRRIPIWLSLCLYHVDGLGQNKALDSKISYMYMASASAHMVLLQVYGCAGLVCTGRGSEIVGWDLRAWNPMVFAAGDYSPVCDMLALEASEGHGSPKLLTGGSNQHCCLLEA